MPFEATYNPLAGQGSACSEEAMQTRTFLLVMAIGASTAVPAHVGAQASGYPQTIIPPAKGPFISAGIPDALGKD